MGKREPCDSPKKSTTFSLFTSAIAGTGWRDLLELWTLLSIGKEKSVLDLIWPFRSITFLSKNNFRRGSEAKNRFHLEILKKGRERERKSESTILKRGDGLLQRQKEAQYIFQH